MLKRAIYELKEFERKYGKKPTSKSKEMNIIYNTSRLGKWKEFGINNWNDLLYTTFKQMDS